MNPREQVQMRAGAAGRSSPPAVRQPVARGCTASGSNPYSPECVEVEFYELRLDGVLRRSLRHLPLYSIRASDLYSIRASNKSRIGAMRCPCFGEYGAIVT